MRISLSVSQKLGVAVLSTLSILAGCDDRSLSPRDDNRLDVVSTSTIMTDWVDRVGGEAIDGEGILEPGADPHVYEPVPQDSIALENADVIFYNGYNLEPALIKLIEGVGTDAEKVPVGEAVQPLNFEYEGQTEPDPHVWGDVENAIVMVEVIREVLVERDPENADTYTENAAALTEELQRLDTWIETQIATIPENQRNLITTHDAFQYYASAYGLNVVGTLIGISTEEQPSAQTVQQLVENVKETGVPAIFAETTINPQLISTVAEEAGVTLAEPELYSDSIGAVGSEGDSYIKMMVSNTCAIANGLGGDCTPFTAK
ncbi:metal ABC transporter solute-binding protein, Zn/Mn family [Baaleninema sp.]|uniref:metal ABC transporter solute-binding protein, Zn/Mn family n=1 Tax=Baaleninema sp. TaxID=3101197 RepID=UPI003D0793A9